MKKTVRASIDRREGDTLVLVPDEGNTYFYLNANEFPFRVGEIVLLTVEGETVLSCEALPDETARREQRNKNRLAALFAKGKKPNS